MEATNEQIYNDIVFTLVEVRKNYCQACSEIEAILERRRRL